MSGKHNQPIIYKSVGFWMIDYIDTQIGWRKVAYLTWQDAIIELKWLYEVGRVRR